MGAGSAKGLRKSASADEADNISVSSDGRWVDNDKGNEGASGTSIMPLDDNKRSKSFEFPPSFSKNNELKVSNGGEGNEDDGESNKDSSQTKKGGRKIWNFFSDKDNNEDESIGDIGDSEINNSSNKETSRRFKIFGSKKKEVKDEKLDNEINDLEKTFDSLGIVGKSVWEGGQDIKPKQKSKDDLATLEPMRNRLNVRMARPPRGINGLTAGNERRLDTGSDLSSTSSSKKKFNFSWDNEDDNQSLEIDEWDYRAIKIEGFDPNKFKKANVEDQVAINGGRVSPVQQNLRFQQQASPPISRGSTSSPPLQYDADDQQILASIEKALME